MKIQTTRVFSDLQNSDKRINVFQGSSRASKTYNILIWFVIKLLNEENKVLSVVRKTLPALKGSVLRDLKEILDKLGLLEAGKWHQADGYYELGTNIIQTSHTRMNPALAISEVDVEVDTTRILEAKSTTTVVFRIFKSKRYKGS
jgi:hypothetical protein